MKDVKGTYIAFFIRTWHTHNISRSKDLKYCLNNVKKIVFLYSQLVYMGFYEYNYDTWLLRYDF